MKLPTISEALRYLMGAACATALLASAQGMPSQGAPMSGTTSANKAGIMDMDSMVRDGFLRDVSSRAQMEMETSQLALTKSSNDGIKQLAQQVVQDYHQFGADLVAVAKVHNTALPTSLPGRFKKSEKKLQALGGSAFDQEYLSQLKRDVNSDQKQAKQSEHAMDDAALQKFAVGVQTSAENRLHQIEDVAKSANLNLK